MSKKAIKKKWVWESDLTPELTDHHRHHSSAIFEYQSSFFLWFHINTWHDTGRRRRTHIYILQKKNNIMQTMYVHSHFCVRKHLINNRERKKIQLENVIKAKLFVAEVRLVKNFFVSACDSVSCKNCVHRYLLQFLNCDLCVIFHLARWC